MELTQRLRNIFFLSLFIFSLAFISTQAGTSAYYPASQIITAPEDTTKTDTTRNLPFPFKDQPAFGKVSQDSLKLFLNKPGNIKYEIVYDPVTGQYVFYEKVGTLNYRLPQSMTI